MKNSVKVLTVGNSFTDSLAEFLPAAVKSAGCEIRFERANFGGCELERHWSYISAEENSQICRIYQGGRKLRDILESEKWDFVTIQQASHKSWDETSYQPWATKIHDYIRKHAPSAEVLIQQTWAYHPNDPRLQPGGEWGFDQEGMYERLTKAYRKLAKELKLRVIPSGLAVQTLRKTEKVKFKPYDLSVLKTLHWPDLPSMAGEPVGSYRWSKDAQGALFPAADLIHLNERGRYLQACVWFAFLFERSAEEIGFVPEMIDGADAEFMRKVADKAVRTFPQVKK